MDLITAFKNKILYSIVHSRILHLDKFDHKRIYDLIEREYKQFIEDNVNKINKEE